jgi:hypothetical protein
LFEGDAPIATFKHSYHAKEYVDRVGDTETNAYEFKPIKRVDSALEKTVRGYLNTTHCTCGKGWACWRCLFENELDGKG